MKRVSIGLFSAFVVVPVALLSAGDPCPGVVLQDDCGTDAVCITFQGMEANADGTSSWAYLVEEIPGGKDLSHWNLALAPDATVLDGTTTRFEVGVDGATGFYGVKWDLTDRFTQGVFIIVLDSQPDVTPTGVLVECGTAPDQDVIEGPFGDGVGGDSPPGSLMLRGTIRDFLGRDDPDVDGVSGHTDFQRQPDAGYGHYMGNIDMFLGAQRKPAFDGGGYKVTRQWMNASNRPIHPSLFDEDAGDTPGIAGVTDNGGIDSSVSFAQWFRDVPGVNLGKELDIEFLLGINGVYTFEDNEFFPIDDDLLGNVGRDHNYHFTFELLTEFVYHEGAGQVFTFTGDDDVWVFINDQMVIDIGGVHSAVSQTVDLDRLGLADGQVYPLSFFSAERHTTESHFRIETTLELVPIELPTVAAQYD
ncbi:MAG: fibro-slime domain-containing protein [Phycisphaerales bacterium]|nr:fibro-slime domain-containing protein [Phycisphaerales bacterium]